jgi:uncharacterized protein YlzI (FlbEa/FlbD family)
MKKIVNEKLNSVLNKIIEVRMKEIRFKWMRWSMERDDIPTDSGL